MRLHRSRLPRIGLSVAVAAMAGVCLEAKAGPTVTACSAERAAYEMRVPDDDGRWQLHLIPAGDMAGVASDLYVRLTTPQRAYWFGFAVSQGYGGISLLPASDPAIAEELGDTFGTSDGENGNDGADISRWLRFMAFDEDMNVASDPPMHGDRALPYVMVPELGVALWYEAAALTGDPNADRDYMPRGVFRLKGCEEPPVDPSP